MATENQGLFFLWMEVLLDQMTPEAASCSQFGDFLRA